MIIYGWKTSSSKFRTLGVGTCKECQKGPLRAFTLFKYFHIYWIPLLPYARQLWLNCEHCQATYDSKEAAGQSIPAGELARDKFPLRMFTGLAALVVLIGLVVWAEQRDQEKYAALLANPQAGDLIVLKLENSTDDKYPYGVAKVISSDENEVHLSPSTYLFPTSSSAHSQKSMKLLSAPEAFTPDKQLVYPRKNLLALFKEGKIAAAFRTGFVTQPTAPKVPGVQVSVR